MSRVWRMAERGGIVAAAMVLAAPLCGCLLVGVSSRGGWFVWPRGFGLVVVFALLLFLLLRRRR